MSLAGLAVAFVGSAYAPWTFIFLSIYFAVCWIVWFVCALAAGKSETKHLLVLWILIDVAILLQCIGFERAYGHGSLTGVEFLWGFSYAPVVFPTGLAYFLLLENAFYDTRILEFFNSTFGYVIGSWINASLAGAIQTVLVILVMKRGANVRVVDDQRNAKPENIKT
ncbi:MAG: hypothetical protein V4634_04095 [Pseudomonadota bacterium]